MGISVEKYEAGTLDQQTKLIVLFYNVNPKESTFESPVLSLGHSVNGLLMDEPYLRRDDLISEILSMMFVNDLL